MKSQSFKSFTLAALFAIAAIFGTAASASAQTKLNFETEFDFQIGGETMDAGKYELKRTTGSTYVVRNVETGKSHLLAITVPVASKANSESVVFNRYGNRYFLRGIYFGRDGKGIDLGTSSAEKAMRRGVLLAGGGKPVEVAVTLGN